MDQSKDIGRHEADIETIKVDIKEMRSDMNLVKEYIIQRKTERKIGWLILSGVGAIGGAVGSMFPFLSDFFKAKGLN